MAASCVLGLEPQEGRYENDPKIINLKLNEFNVTILSVVKLLSKMFPLDMLRVYYDAYYNDQTLNEEHFGIIESQAKKAVAVCFEF